MTRNPQETKNALAAAAPLYLRCIQTLLCCRTSMHKPINNLLDAKRLVSFLLFAALLPQLHDRLHDPLACELAVLIPVVFQNLNILRGHGV
ncbi:hypothetical protein GOP47_0015310 [Adiantum capillus-veneris]|uniref:Uncharacterized protein n=1 Tax=Adiantum capillus-veneris TaxID=13818 RepID=A0A9D4ZBJ6_ADICA|nr:hypothetical protein GOP47_0015310 [Adiantum capillus-veneris]